MDGEDTIDNYGLGYQYNFSQRTLLWAEYIGRKADTLLYGDQNVMSIGAKVLFQLHLSISAMRQRTPRGVQGPDALDQRSIAV